MDNRIQPKQWLFLGLAVSATALMWSATARAASNSVVPCDQVGRDLQSLEVLVDALPVDAVDHVPIDLDSIDEQTAVSDSAVPILNLTPRVTSILREVFGLAIEDMAPQTSSSSPVAGSDAELDDLELVDTEIDRSDLPQFQQRMFRTDI